MFKPKQAEYTLEQHKTLIKPQSAGSWGTRAQYFAFFYGYPAGAASRLIFQVGANLVFAHLNS
jgi:hypothetical protein